MKAIPYRKHRIGPSRSSQIVVRDVDHGGSYSSILLKVCIPGPVRACNHLLTHITLLTLLH